MVEILMDLNWKLEMSQWKHLAIESQNPMLFLHCDCLRYHVNIYSLFILIWLDKWPME